MTTDTTNPLDMPLGAAKEPEFPRLAEGVMNMVIRQAELKGEGSSERINLKLETTEEQQSHEGFPLQPGFGFFEPLWVGPNEKRSADEIVRRVGVFARAALGADANSITLTQLKRDPSILVGKIVKVKVGSKQQKSGDRAGEWQNTVKAWLTE